jgi:hypothetical protein
MTTRTAVASGSHDPDRGLVGHQVDIDLDPRVKEVILVNKQFMADPSRCDAPWCGELLSVNHDHRRTRGAATCNEACAKRLSRWRQALRLGQLDGQADSQADGHVDQDRSA